MRKKKFMGVKFHQRHTKKDLEAFAALGAAIRSDATKMGFLMKRGDGHQTWKRRWCVLSSTGLGCVIACAVGTLAWFAASLTGQTPRSQVLHG